MFAVYRGQSYADFRKMFPEHYNKCIPKLLEKLENIATVKRCDVQILDLIRSMLDDTMSNRPSADTIWKRATTCTNSSTANGNVYFCGPCCMPFPSNAGPRELGVELDLTQMPYHCDMPLVNRSPFGEDPNFEVQHGPDEPLGFEWVRNVRHGSFSLHDVVKCASERDQLGRKIVLRLPKQPVDVAAAAKHEARLTSQLSHRHVIKFQGTYQQGNIYGLLFQPAADYDLRTYLQRIGLHNAKASSPKLPFLADSFGCLANGLKYVHDSNIFHGDIKPENILVHAGRVFLAKFGQAANYGFSSATNIAERKKLSDPSDLVSTRTKHRTP